MIKAKFNARGCFYLHREQPIACWNWFDWLLVHEGTVCVHWNSKSSLELHTGQSVLIFPNTKFRCESATKVSVASANHFWMKKTCNCGGSFLNSLYKKKNGYRVFSQPLSGRMLYDVDLILDIAYENPDQAAMEIVSKRMELILIELDYREKLQKISPKMPEFNSLKEWLTENVDQLITLNQMAEYLNMSTSLFRKLFRKRYGIGPGRYFLNIRMQQAARLLAETSFPIKTIAAHVGYAELPHFHRAFKKVFSLTPRIYRLQNSAVF